MNRIMKYNRRGAIVYYRSLHGPIEVSHYLGGLSDLHSLVELGPDWDTIEKIDIRFIGAGVSMTVEGAEVR